MTPGERVLQLIGRGEAWLDERLTLAGAGGAPVSIPFPVQVRAREIGRRLAREAWDPGCSAEQNLLRLGVSRVRWMSPMEELAFPCRALYDPGQAQVLVSRARLDEMADVQDALHLHLFSPAALYDRLLAHECFHHLEEIRSARLHEMLAETAAFPPALRDVGAHAFANGVCGGPPCQAVDLLWLAFHDPQRLEAI